MGKRRLLAIGAGAALAAASACRGGVYPDRVPSPSEANSVPSRNTNPCTGQRQRVYFAHTLLPNGIDDDRGDDRNVARKVMLRQDVFVLFDAKSGNLAFPPPLPEEREGTASTLLRDGRVLVVGGRVYDESGAPRVAWLYDDTKGWSPAGILREPRISATATLLQSGDVLIAGGRRVHHGNATTDATRWLAKERRFVEEPPMQVPRAFHAAVTLPDGRVLIVGGGHGYNVSSASTEIFDPVKHLFTPGPPLPQQVSHPAAAASPMGAVVVAGEGVFHLPTGRTSWTTLSADERFSSRGPARNVVMLSDCVAFVTSRFGVEAYDLITNTRVYEASPAVAREAPAVLRVDDRTVLVASSEGYPPAKPKEQASRSAESFTLTTRVETPSFGWKLVEDVFDIEWTEREVPELPFLSLGSKLWIGTPSAPELLHGESTSLPGDGFSRAGATLTSLGGKALLVGKATRWQGTPEGEPPRPSQRSPGNALVFDASKHTWKRTGQPRRARWDHVAVRLQDGSVAIIGGSDVRNGVLPIERWDPRSGSFRDVSRLRWPRVGHAATLLGDGGVLVTGGCGIGVPQEVAEVPAVLEEPESSQTAELVRPGRPPVTSELGAARCGHTAVLLGDGRVLVVGGFPEGAFHWYLSDLEPTASTAVWAPSTGRWTPAASMHAKRGTPAALLLPDGRVLVAGGETKDTRLPTAEAYDPKTDSWSVLGVLPMLFERPLMAPLGAGRVLLQGDRIAIELTIEER